MEYCLAMKKKQITGKITTGVNLKNTLLNESKWYVKECMQWYL